MVGKAIKHGAKFCKSENFDKIKKIKTQFFSNFKREGASFSFGLDFCANRFSQMFSLSVYLLRFVSYEPPTIC